MTHKTIAKRAKEIREEIARWGIADRAAISHRTDEAGGPCRRRRPRTSRAQKWIDSAFPAGTQVDQFDRSLDLTAKHHTIAS